VSLWQQHVVIAPVVLPLSAGALLLLFDERRHALKAVVSLASTLALIGVANA
jgi:multicomponent K+:H+ antiporter subunit D